MRLGRDFLRAVLLLEVAADIGLLVWTVMSEQAFLLPTAVIRLLLMGLLGVMALRGKAWARWCFAGVLGLTAVAGGLVGLVSFTGGAHYVARPSTLAVAAIYGAAFAMVVYARPESGEGDGAR